MPHTSEHSDADAPLSLSEAESLAESIAAFATASRLRLMVAMLDGERNVEDLSKSANLSQSATSQQLRVLRQARLVRVRRDGRRAFYSLFDHHVPELLAAMRNHHEHVNPQPSPPVPRARQRSATR